MDNHELEPAEVRFQDGPEARKLRDSASELAIYIEKLSIFQELREDKRNALYFGDLPSALRSFRWAWPLEQNEVSINDLDRRKPLLGGPLFTSSQFPWPTNDDGFLQPIAQIDLDMANDIAGLNLGHGMLQIWTDAFGMNSLIRIIPNEKIEDSELAPIPPDLEKSPNLQDAFSYVMMDWGKNASTGPQQIIGLGTKILTWPSSLHALLSDFQEKLSGRDAESIQQFLKKLPEESPSPTPHLFGNFREIQYAAQERPPCLLSLDSDEPFGWGDGGTAQVFFNPKRKIIDTSGQTKVAMFFEWSCG